MPTPPSSSPPNRPRPDTPARRNRRGRATEERIREAALQVLAEKGLDLTVDEIATVAETTRMTVYRHLGSRDRLLLDLVAELTDRFAERLAEILDADRPFPERVEESFVHVLISTRSPAIRQAVALATTDPTGAWGAIDTEGRVMREVLDFLRPRLVAAARETQFRHDPDETLAWLLRQAQSYLVLPDHGDQQVEAVRREVRAFVIPAILADP